MALGQFVPVPMEQPWMTWVNLTRIKLQRTQQSDNHVRVSWDILSNIYVGSFVELMVFEWYLLLIFVSYIIQFFNSVYFGKGRKRISFTMSIFRFASKCQLPLSLAHDRRALSLINNNKHVYHQSQVRNPISSEVKWVECSRIIGTGCWVHVFAWSLIAQSVCEWAFSLLAIWCLRLHSVESCIQQRKTACLLSIRKSLACVEHQN